MLRYKIIFVWNGLRLCRLPYSYYSGKALGEKIAVAYIQLTCRIRECQYCENYHTGQFSVAAGLPESMV